MPPDPAGVPVTEQMLLEELYDVRRLVEITAGLRLQVHVNQLALLVFDAGKLVGQIPQLPGGSLHA